MDTLEQRRAQLRALVAEKWEHDLRESPEFATMIGDHRYDHLWSDISLEHMEQHKRDAGAWLARFEAVDPTGFPEQEGLDHRLMLRDLKETLEDLEFKGFEMPVDQLDGLHLLLAQFVTYMPFATVKDYENYLARLRGLPRVLDQMMDLMRQGVRDGLVQPRYLLEKTVEQCGNIAEPAGLDNVFGRPAAEIPATFEPADRESLCADIVAVVDEHVRPAYLKLMEFIREEYAPQGRTELGAWSLPDGERRYRFLIRYLTTTDMDPDEIHELGLQEVARIEAEQAAIATRLGYADLGAMREALKTDKKYFASSPQQLIDLQKRYIGQMEARLPEMFGLLPCIPLDVRPVQKYREKEAAAAEYHSGTPDGTRPGVVYVNTGDYEKRSLIGVEAVAYHEGVPGHHLQVAIAECLPPLPPFRQHGYYGAYTEGWALYSERLGKEAGFYETAEQDYGRLSNELLRAVRLVLDTGVHHMHWSREQMLDYFRAHSDEDEPDLQAEVDRYIVIPAQALTYKLGELEILRLRQKAEATLGSRFDIRAFHDRLLDGGALPLDVLAERVDAWIADQMEEQR